MFVSLFFIHSQRVSSFVYYSGSYLISAECREQMIGHAVQRDRSKRGARERVDGLVLGLDEVLQLEGVVYVSCSSLSCTAGFRIETTSPSSSWAEFRYLPKYLASLISISMLQLSKSKHHLLTWLRALSPPMICIPTVCHFFPWPSS